MFQNSNGTILVVPASCESIYVPDQSRTSSRSSSPFRSCSPSRSPATPHTPACSPVELQKAGIESTFRTIEYGTFRDKPACLIVIDVRFVYNKKYQMRSANIQFTFNKDPSSSTSDISFPRTTNAYGPTDSFGDVESVSSTQNICLNTPGTVVGCNLPTATIGSSSVRTQNQKWQIQGTRQIPKQGPSQTYNWTIFDNDLSSFDSFPRDVTLWMIIEHDNMPFYANVHMEGKLRGHMARTVVSRLSSYYDDKKAVSKTLVPEVFVPELSLDSSVNAPHNIWNCLTAKREGDDRIFTPPACTRVRFDEAKLRAALGGLTSGLWNEDIIECIKDGASETEQDANSIYFRLSCHLKRSPFGIKRKAIAAC